MRSARRVATIVLPALAGALLVRTALAGRHDLGHLIDHPRWGLLAAMLGAAAFAMVWIAAQWEQVMRAMHHGLGTGRAVAVYFVGEIGKYLPGGIWPVVGRAELATRQVVGVSMVSAQTVSAHTVSAPVDAPVDRATSYLGVLMSLAYLFLAGLLCAGAAAGLALSHGLGSPAPLLLLLLLPVGLGCLHPGVAGRLVAAVAGRFRRSDAPPLVFPAWRTSVGLVLRYVPAWAGVMAASWFAAQALDARPGVALLALAACLGWVAGFLVLPAPGGIGAREAVFAAVLGTSVAPGRAAAVATLARLAFVAVDAGGAALSALWLARRRAGSAETD